MTYIPEYLKKWTLPDSYFGAEWPEYYVFLGQHRDSDTLTRSNFRSGLRAIGGQSDTVRVIRESHCLVGWVEWVAIHESDGATLRVADEIVAALEDYPVVDDSDLSELETDLYLSEWEGFCGYWNFTSALAHKFHLAEDDLELLDELPLDQLREFFESLIPSGEYWTPYSDGISIRTDVAVENCTYEDLQKFLAEAYYHDDQETTAGNLGDDVSLASGSTPKE